MTKEKAIMELIDKSQEIEALESCIKILEGWSETTELAKPLKENRKNLRQKKSHSLTWRWEENSTLKKHFESRNGQQSPVCVG